MEKVNYSLVSNLSQEGTFQFQLQTYMYMYNVFEDVRIVNGGGYLKNISMTYKLKLLGFSSLKV